jgi:hypothetical protein
MLAVLALLSSTANGPSRGRLLSEDPILSYYPASGVYDHNRIDLDQAAMESAFQKSTCVADIDGSTCDGITNGDVKAVYEKGGYSGPQGTCTWTTGSGLTTALAKKAQMEYSVDGTNFVTKKTSASAAATDKSVKFYYATASDRLHVNTLGATGPCIKGGIPSTYTGFKGATGPYIGYNAAGCIAATTSKVRIGAASDGTGGQTYTCATVDNSKASRTLQGFSTKAKKLMYDSTMSGAPAEDTSKSYKNGVPYTSYKPYFDYYCAGTASCNGNGGYADDIVQAALTGSKTTLANGNWDLAPSAGNQKIEVIKKATAYMHAWMYAVREFEDAIDDCTGGSLTANDMSSSSVHAWDEGVAFYTGSIMQTGHLSGAGGDDTDSTYALLNLNSPGVGKLAYTLGNKRCRNFKTCGPDGTTNIGQSQQNYELFKLFNDGSYHLRKGDCAAAVPVKNKIVQWMTIPLVQGSLRYAYETGVLAGSEKGRAEGAIFAAAVLPQVHACNAAHATTIHTELVGKLATGTVDFTAVKAAFEACYPTMFPDIALRCAAVGRYGGSDGVSGPSTDAKTAICVDAVASTSSSMSTGAAIGIAAGCGFAVLFLLLLCCVIQKEKAGTPLFTPLAKPGTSA